MHPVSVLTPLLRGLLIHRWSLLLLICPTVFLNGPATLTRYRSPMSRMFQVVKM